MEILRTLYLFIIKTDKMVNKNIYDFIVNSGGNGNLQKTISEFTTCLQKELIPYIPNWEIMDLQVEENFEGSNSIYIWLHDQFSRGKEREVRIDFRDTVFKFSKVDIYFLDDNRSLENGHCISNVDNTIIGTVEFLASTSRWFRDMIEPKILYTAVQKGIHCETI